MADFVHPDFHPQDDNANVGGFSFENVQRNSALLDAMDNHDKANNSPQAAAAAANGGHVLAAPQAGAGKLPRAKKTGTTIAGAIFDGGLVLGADTRATNGDIVATKNCEKIHYLAPNIYCCGAGTAADTEKTTELISSQLELLRMETHSQSRVVTACTLLKRMLFRYQGHIGAALVLGGCDLKGPHLYQIHPHGSTGKLPYTTQGSGSLAAIAVFESSWREGMNEREAIQLVHRAIGAGIFNDLGSGSNIDICIIRNDGTVENRRNDVKPNEVGPLKAAIQQSERFNLPVGVTPVLRTEYRAHPTVATRSTATEMEVEG